MNEYYIWNGMKGRCFNLNRPEYKNYGGRGITVCDEWKNDFWKFYESVGKRPSKKHTIDRIDNDGNYEPGNVKWSTRSEQRRNQRVIGRSGHKHIFESKGRVKRWKVLINIGGVLRYFGRYENIEEAIMARDVATGGGL